MELEVKDRSGKVVGSISVKENILPEEGNVHLLYLSVKSFLDNQRLGTAKTKTRGEVSGGGKKPWRQKGTGRARHGSIRSPIWRGGGIVFGPVPRCFYHSLPRGEKRKSFLLALSEKIGQQALAIVDNLDFQTPKTREAVSFLKTFGISEGEKVLLVTANRKEGVVRAFANLPLVVVKPVNEVNTYLLLWSKTVIMEKEAFLKLVEVYGGER
ncbi:MAG: 50S ribosomal protein L4 [Candidatus Atribacteria bacterium]|nr:50S ribosomal protein L4 [Candidatus Atribacteria bacterium]